MLKNNSGKRVAFIASCLNDSLQNKDLHDYIFNKLNIATSKSCKDIHVLENGLYITYKNGDIFEITFEPCISNYSKIITNFLVRTIIVLNIKYLILIMKKSQLQNLKLQFMFLKINNLVL